MVYLQRRLMLLIAGGEGQGSEAQADGFALGRKDWV